MRRNNDFTQPYRTRKTVEQQRYLIWLYDSNPSGRFSREVRQRAREATGLTWLQIYKWMFDRRQRKKIDAEYLLINYNLPIFVVERRNKVISKKMRIFKASCNAKERPESHRTLQWH